MIKIDWRRFILYNHPLGFYWSARSSKPDSYSTRIGWSWRAALGLRSHLDSLFIYEFGKFAKKYRK